MKTYGKRITEDGIGEWLDEICNRAIKKDEHMGGWTDSDISYYDSILMMVGDFFRRVDEDD